MSARIDHERDLHYLQARDWRNATAEAIELEPAAPETRFSNPADFLNARPRLRQRFLNALALIARP